MIFGLFTIILIVQIYFSSGNNGNTLYTVQWSEFRRIPEEKTTIWPLFKSPSSPKVGFKPMQKRTPATASVNTRISRRNNLVNLREPDIIVVIRAESKDDDEYTTKLIKNRNVNKEYDENSGLKINQEGNDVSSEMRMDELCEMGSERSAEILEDVTSKGRMEPGVMNRAKKMERMRTKGMKGIGKVMSGKGSENLDTWIPRMEPGVMKRAKEMERMRTEGMRGIGRVMSGLGSESLDPGSLKSERLPNGSGRMKSVGPQGQSRMELEILEPRTTSMGGMEPKGMGWIEPENNERMEPKVMGKFRLKKIGGQEPQAEPKSVGENMKIIEPNRIKDKRPKLIDQFKGDGKDKMNLSDTARMRENGIREMNRMKSDGMDGIGLWGMDRTKPDGMSLHRLGPQRIHQGSGSIRAIKADGIVRKGGIVEEAPQRSLDAQKKTIPKHMLRQRLILRQQVQLPIETDSRSEYTIATSENTDSDYSEFTESEANYRSHRRAKRSEKSKRRKHHKSRTPSYHKNLEKEIRRKIHRYENYMNELDKEFSNKNSEVEDQKIPNYRTHRHRKRHKGKGHKRKTHKRNSRNRKAHQRNRYKRHTLRRNYKNPVFSEASDSNAFSEDGDTKVLSESEVSITNVVSENSANQ